MTARQKKLASLLLLFLTGSVCALGERGIPRLETGAAQNEVNDETTVVSNRFTAPSFGYVFDSESQALLPILGAPGAATFGSRIEFGLTLQRAWVAPGQSFVLAEVEESQEVQLLDMQQGSQAGKTLPGLPKGANQVAVSSTGSAMALYYRNEHRLQIASRLPGEPEVSSAFDLFALPGELSSLAVSDDGQTALVAFTEDGTGSVYLVDSEHKRLIVPAGDVRAMTFLPNSRNAVIADTTANEVRLLIDVTGSATQRILADEGRGISHPLMLQASADSSRVFILNSGAEAITTVDLNTGLLSHLPITASVSRLQRLGGDVFQLTGNLKQSMLLFDAASPEARILFVPKQGSVNLGARSALRDRLPEKRQPLPLRERSD